MPVMNTGQDMEGLDIGEETVDKLETKPFSLKVVKGFSCIQIPGGFLQSDDRLDFHLR